MKEEIVLNKFAYRHIGPNLPETEAMLKELGVDGLEDLIREVIPENIRLNKELEVGQPIDEIEYLKQTEHISHQNKVYRSYIGMGYYNTIVPPIIQRSLFESPGWYTQYTPYQAEIAQGRLESLLNFQTMIIDLTGLEIANASLLDEGTAAAEAMMMFYRISQSDKNLQDRHKFFVDQYCFPQTIDVVRSRGEQMGVEVVVGDFEKLEVGNDFFGVLLQFPNGLGEVVDYRGFIEKSKLIDIQVVVASDLLSLTIITPPGEWGADVVLGNSQRFGVPLGYGGPHAAFFSTTEKYKRQIPGRIIGVSKDRYGNVAYRMSLQTREQHIRKDKATSNICTAQALLANMSAMYGVYHGKSGLTEIATMVHSKIKLIKKKIEELGYKVITENFFDTITIEDDEDTLELVHLHAMNKDINFRKTDIDKLSLSLDETVIEEDLNDIVQVFAEVSRKRQLKMVTYDELDDSFSIQSDFVRKSDFLTHPVFNRNRSETGMLRYLNYLEKKDLSLNTSMIPLGSCTMKLNAATEMAPVSWKRFSGIHPFVPVDQTKGYQEIFLELEKMLIEITGFDAISLQPNSGAQGEYAGLLAIKKYHESRGEDRDLVLIPVSAHGTNPASAIMAGLNVLVVDCRENGDVDVDDLSAKAEQNKERLAGLMITYPSTHGVFEEEIKNICDIIHQYGGQVYMDGANMNAHIGYINPAGIGADVCHMNLHKTFAIPHGGGGPGMGPIGVRKHLSPFLPGHVLVPVHRLNKGAVSSAPWGSASILLISYAYIKMLGDDGLKHSTAYAILNANYLMKRLEKHYSVLYKGKKNRVAHEMIIDIRPIEEKTGISVEDIAKRLMDYGFHAPTISFPVVGTMMIEPTESEDKEELDRFAEAMISIKKEIDEIADGKVDKTNNLLKNAPHSHHSLIDWDYPYSIERAIFPLPYLKKNKFWPAVGRVDNVYGDRNFICSCPSPMDYTS